MKHPRNVTRFITIAALLATVVVSTVAFAQSLKIKGVIISRTGNTMTMKTDTGNIVVVLNDGTVCSSYRVFSRPAGKTCPWLL